MAELLRKRNQFDEAMSYAKKAIKYGAPKAPLTLANIYHSQAQILIDKGKSIEANSKLKDALGVLSNFRPEFGHDQEISDSISSKIYRLMNDFISAENKILKYTTTNNPYTIYEQCKVIQYKIEVNRSDSEYVVALEQTQKALSIIISFEAINELPQALKELKLTLESVENSLIEQTNSK